MTTATVIGADVSHFLYVSNTSQFTAPLPGKVRCLFVSFLYNGSTPVAAGTTIQCLVLKNGLPWLQVDIVGPAQENWQFFAPGAADFLAGDVIKQIYRVAGAILTNTAYAIQLMDVEFN